MKIDNNTYKISDVGKQSNISIAVGVLFLLISVLGYFQDPAHFYLNYLTAYFFWLTIALGGLFFVMLHHLTGAQWSIVLRKISESIAGTIPILTILFIPIVFGMSDLYHWTHEDAVLNDKLLQGKAPYLNSSFFLIRAAIYLAVWNIFVFLLRRVSSQQDKAPSEALSKKMRKISAPGIILFAMTITFASFDWLMSLDAHWFSTIFGVYIFSGSFMSFLTFIIVACVYLRRKNILTNIITVEHYHDLAKLAFAFVIFWAYMGFSQYFLIWYANLPEENYWFLYRWDNSWEAISMIIIYGHFVVPFVALIARAGKRKLSFLTFISIWLLVMHYIDLYWVVLPTHYREGIHFNIIDLAPVVGIGGLFIFMFLRNLSSGPAIPVSDPKLKKSINFSNG